VLALLTGVSLGVLGGGGSIITLPVLLYVARIEPKPAVGMALAIVGSTSAVGSYLHARHGNFYWRAAVYFGAAGVVGSYFGSTFTHFLPSRVLVMLFALIMLIAGSLMLTRRTGGDAIPHHVHPPCSMQRFLATGFGVGCLSGFLGVGGGFLIVPALVWFIGLDTKRAVGTSLAVIACNSASGLIGQLRYTHWDWAATGEFIAVSLVGMGMGVALARRAPDRILRKAFGVAVIAIAVAMGFNPGR
jgi:hypothetical protein